MHLSFAYRTRHVVSIRRSHALRPHARSPQNGILDGDYHDRFAENPKQRELLDRKVGILSGGTASDDGGAPCCASICSRRRCV